MTINLNGTTGITTTGLTSNGIDDNATSTAMTLDTSGNVLVGTTNSTPHNLTSGGGFSVRGSINLFSIARQDNEAMIVNRTGTDGDIALFRKNGTTVGSIGVSGQLFAVGRGDTTLGFDDANDAIYARGTSGAYRPDAIDLGSSNNRFKDLYLSGGVYLGGTGSDNKLDDYEEGTWTIGVSFDTSGSATVYSTAAASGRYTKIGNTVHVTGFFSTSSISSPVGIFRLTGLPFAVSAAADTAGSIGYTRRWGSDMPNLKISASVGNTTCYFNKNATNATTTTFLEGSDLSSSNNGNSLYFQITYQTT